MARCTARQESDQMVCRKCGLAWDMNDPDPPTCPVREPSTPSPAEQSKYQLVRYTTARNLIDRAYQAGRDRRPMDDIIDELQLACGR